MVDKAPVTAAVRVLREHGIAYVEHLYPYEERGGTAASAAALGVPEHEVIKTLVMEDEGRKPLIVLMHGDCEVSTKNLARLLGRKSIEPCKPEVANKHSGYVVGGTSPFGTKRPMPVYMESTISALGTIYVNGGKRGFLVALSPSDLVTVLAPTMVSVAIPKS